MTDRPQADEEPFVNVRTPLDHRFLAMQTKSARPAWLRHLAAQCFVGGIGIILVTFVCFELEANTAAASSAYLILVALLSLMGTLIGSFALAIVAVACLNYFFAPPIFSFGVDHPEDVLTIAAFFTTSMIIAGLTAKLRKTAEEAKASQDALVNAIPALVWSALPDGSRDFNSQRLLGFAGRSAEEALGDGWITVLHPHDRARVAAKWQSSTATGERFEVEARARRADGEYRWFLVRAEPLRDRSGTIVKWYGTSIDIEDRKRAEEALHESNAYWREVFEHNPVMYFVVDASGRVLSVNSFGAAQLGYTVGELVGQSVLDVFLPEERELVRQNVASCLENPGEASTWEIRKIRKDGTIIWVRENAKAVMSVPKNAEGERRADNEPIVLIACEDITERKRVEDALRESEMYLAEAQRIGHTGSFGWRVASGHIVWSKETFRIFEFDPAIKPSLDVIFPRIHPEDRAPLRQTLERAAQEGRDWELGHRLLMPDGSVKHVRVVAHAVRDASNNLEFIGAITDVTAMKHADEELNEARAELARVARVTTVGELTAAIAHEINQPLTGVISSGDACLRWLDGHPPNLEAARRAVERMLRDATRAGEVLSRIRALVVKSPPQRAWLTINDLILEVIVLVRGDIQRNGISLRTELGKDLPPVLGDRVQLQQVVLNLIVNAIEAMSKNGQAQRDLVIASGKDASDGVLVSVQDSGPGLEHAELDRVFDAFYTSKPDGMGMGLSISRTIIEAHAGQLWATANALRGVTFRFRLPTEG